jgi:soluble lytic murein transglycosylase-like protein
MKMAFLIMTIAMVMLSAFPTTAREKDAQISKTAYQACVEYGGEYNICPELLMAIIETESSGDQYAQNGSCVGLMQVNEPFHTDRMDRLGVTDLFDTRQNIHTASDYLSELYQEYEDTYMVLAVYNMGQVSAERLFKKGIYETKYAVKICDRSMELEQLHNK